MVTIFTTPSCSSCRKAKKWLEEYNIEYNEKNLMTTKITEKDINDILKNTENGFDDIISRRSKVFIENNLDVDNMTVKELKEFIINNPSVLKRPIIVDDKKIQVGYNDDDIRIFVPKRLREIVMCARCTENEDCDYQLSLAKYLAEIKGEMEKKKAA